MKKICQILAISSCSLFLTACYNSGAQLDKQNVSNMPGAVSQEVVNQNNSVTTSATSAASAVSRAAAGH